MMLESLVCTAASMGYHALSCRIGQNCRLEKEEGGSSSMPVECEDQNCSGNNCSQQAQEDHQVGLEEQE